MQRTSRRETGRPEAHNKVRAATSPKGASGGGARAKKSKAAPKNAPDAVLTQVETVRLAQRQEGNFDCFATAREGHCDQERCLYRAECLDLSQRVR